MTTPIAIPIDDKSERFKLVVACTYAGLHNAPKIRKHATHWEINHHGDLATFDFDRLTRLVLAAHHAAVRVEITSSGPGMVKIRLHPRKREGNIYERHPTIEEAIEGFDRVWRTYCAVPEGRKW